MDRKRRPETLREDMKSERWVTVDEVWHWRAKRFIRRRDGLPFRFRVIDRR